MTQLTKKNNQFRWIPVDLLDVVHEDAQRKLDERNVRHTGDGRFACLEGNEQNWEGLIKQDLKRKHGGVELKMPQRHTLGLKKAS